MKRIYKYILTILILLTPVYVYAADLEITCYQDSTKPTVTAPDKLFNLSNFTPGETSTKTLKVINTATDGNCTIYFKGEGNTNILTNKINIAISDVYGNIVDNKATSNKNLSDFLSSAKILVADVAPGSTIERNLLLTFNTDADNSLQKYNTTFDIRIISEWGVAPTTTEETEVLGTTTKKYKTTKKSTQTTITGTTEEQETSEEEVKGTEECKANIKLFGYVYIDKNKNKEKNKKEKVLANIPIKIYVEENGEKKTIKDITTNKEGYWEITLCSGNYFIETDRNSLPKNTDIEDNISEVTLGTDIQEYNLNIPVNDTRNFWQKYWYLIVGGLAIIVIGYTSIKNRKKEEI